MHFPAPSRDPAARRSTVARNDLFAAWSRLLAASAAARTAGILAAAGRDPATARGVARALRRPAWPLSRRAAIPDRVDRARRLLAAG